MSGPTYFLIEAPRLPLASKPCRGCGRPIYWVTTAAGKRTCLDLYVDHGLDPSGRYVKVDSSETHWASCVARDRFARPKAGTRP